MILIIMNAKVPSYLGSQSLTENMKEAQKKMEQENVIARKREEMEEVS